MTEQISRIQTDINKIQPLNELKRIKNISYNISDFLEGLRDWKAVSLQSLRQTDYSEIIDSMKCMAYTRFVGHTVVR
jgi:succinate dehydrogenase/fumarate reductase-like Fe-S protein